MTAENWIGSWTHEAQTVDGVFESLEGSTVLEFKADGTVTVTSPKSVVTGTYVVSGDKVSFIFPIRGVIMTATKYSSTKLDLFAREAGKDVTMHLEKPAQ